MFSGLIALIIGSALTKPTKNEIREREKLMTGSFYIYFVYR